MSDVTGKPFGDIYAYIDRQIAAAVLAAATDHQTLSHRLRPYDGHDLYPRVDGARGMDSGANLEQGRAPVTDLETATRAWVLAQVGGIQEPLGHDITALPSVISHWPILDSVLAGTSVPDINAAHNGTASNTIRSVGRPWYNSEGQVWLDASRVVSLANVANLITEARDASCYWMGWLFIAGQVVTQYFPFVLLSADETAAKNTPFTVKLTTETRLQLIWEHSAGTDVTLSTEIAGGLHHVCLMREHAGTSTGTIYIDGELAIQTSGLTNPSGATTLSAAYLAYSTAPTGEACHAVVGDCVWGSGGLPTQAQIRVQYQRGMGSY